MATVFRTSLLIVLTWRLLLPPGVCLCQLIHPAAVFLAQVLDHQPPEPEPEQEGHQAGCPVAKLGPSLRAQPADLPVPPALALDCPALSDCPALPAPSLAPLPENDVTAGTAPLYVKLCAFLR